MLVYGDGTTSGTIGGGQVEALIRADALVALDDGATRLKQYTLEDPERGDPGICGGTMTISLEPYMPPHTVFVIGCGHVGRAVVDLAHWLGSRTVATDDRAEFGDRNPNARAWIAVNPDSEVIPVARAGGVLVAMTAPVESRMVNSRSPNSCSNNVRTISLPVE